MNGTTAYVLARKYAEKLSLGVSAATVNGSTVTFTMSDGSTASVTFPEPEDGLSVVDADINANGHLIIHMSDGSTIDAGEMKTKLDKTLTVEGQAADSKAVGDRFAEFNGKYAKQTDINTLQNQITVNKNNISVNKSDIAQHKLDIAEIKDDVKDIRDDITEEAKQRKTTDIELQAQIDKLSAKTQILGATDCPNGLEQSTLSAYARNVTGDSTRPSEGDAVNIVTDGSGNSRAEQWQWVAVQNKWVKMSGPPVVTKATATSLGVVKVPGDGGIEIDSDANITANKRSIGLGNVDNVRQYSKNNPAPVKVTLDGETFTGDTKDGVAVTTGAVRFDKAQSLTDTQKARARVNIGILENEDLTAKVETNETNIAKNKQNIEDLDGIVTDLSDAFDKEVDDRTKADEYLQEQIDKLESKGEWIGSVTNFDENALTRYVVQEKGRQPIDGDTITVLDSGMMYRYNGLHWAEYMVSSQRDATTSVKGVVAIGDGINVSAGVISTDKDAIGLDKVENERQYSAENPAPIKLTVDEEVFEGDTKDGVEVTTNAVKYTSQILTVDEQTQAKSNIGALGVFASETERDNFKAQVETNKDDIADIKDEQVAQNTEIASLKKKSQWIGSIENPDDSEITDAVLNSAILDKLGTTPKEGYQLSVFASDGHSTVYQYSETSKTWAISSKNADLQIASATQLGVMQTGNGLKTDEDGVTTVDTTLIATKAYVDAHAGGGAASQSDWSINDATDPRYIKNKPFGTTPIVAIEYADELGTTEHFGINGKQYYWIGDDMISAVQFRRNYTEFKYTTSKDRGTQLKGGMSYIGDSYVEAAECEVSRYMIEIDDTSYYIAVLDHDVHTTPSVIKFRHGIYACKTTAGYFINSIISTVAQQKTMDASLLDSIYPIGSVYLSVSASNPSTLFGGTWEQISGGRVLVGVGTGTDGTNSRTFEVGEDGTGLYARKITTNELPGHSHTFVGLKTTTESAGSHTHTYDKTTKRSEDVKVEAAAWHGDTVKSVSSANTGSSGSHTHTLYPEGQISVTGEGKAFDVTQPAFGVYIWQRTA